jgi:hypothetical protein
LTTFGLFYDRLFSGDSWLWSSSLVAGHPLWLSIETQPFWDPIAVLCYGIAGTFQLAWSTPYQITVFLWLLVFALGGSACARALSGNRWAGVLAFALLFGGPTAHMIPAQSLGFIIPFRYFPWILYLYISLRREGTPRGALFFSTALAFGFSGYQSPFAIILLLLLISADWFVHRRTFGAWLRNLARPRYAVYLLIPLLAGLPLLAFLYSSREFVIIPREYIFTDLIYFFDPLVLLSQVLYFNFNDYQYLSARYIWHGAAFFGHMAVVLLIHGAQRAVRIAPTVLGSREPPWSACTGPLVVLLGLLAAAVVTCGALGFEPLVRAHGTLLGLRNFGFLLTGVVLLSTLLISYGFSEVLSGRFDRRDLIIGVVSYTAVGVLIVWARGPQYGSPRDLAVAVAVLSAFWLGLLLLRRGVPRIGLVTAVIVVLSLVEPLAFANMTMPSMRGIGAEKWPWFDPESLKQNPRLGRDRESFVEFRDRALRLEAYVPFRFMAPAIFKIPVATMDFSFERATGRSPSHNFRTQSYDDLMAADIGDDARDQILGVTRPVLDLVPRAAIVDRGGALAYVLARAEKGSEDGLAPGPAVSAGRNPSSQSLRVAEFVGDRVLVEVDAPADSILIYRDNYAAGWSVQVDGRNSELLVVDRVNKAVTVPEGRHQVEFVYRPWLYLAAFVLRFVALISAGVLCVFVVLRRRRELTGAPPCKGEQSSC